MHGSCVLSASLVCGDMSCLPEPECCGVNSRPISFPWIEDGVEFWRPDEEGCCRGDGCVGDGLIGTGSGSSSPKISSSPLIREATGRHFALKLSSCPQIWVTKFRSSVECCPLFIPLFGGLKHVAILEFTRHSSIAKVEYLRRAWKINFLGKRADCNLGRNSSKNGYCR